MQRTWILINNKYTSSAFQFHILISHHARCASSSFPLSHDFKFNLSFHLQHTLFILLPVSLSQTQCLTHPYTRTRLSVNRECGACFLNWFWKTFRLLCSSINQWTPLAFSIINSKLLSVCIFSSLLIYPWGLPQELITSLQIPSMRNRRQWGHVWMLKRGD